MEQEFTKIGDEVVVGIGNPAEAPKKIEEPHIFKLLNLSVGISPDKNFIISFETGDRTMAKVYSQAIHDICYRHDLNPANKIGGGGNGLNRGGWELWAKTDEETLKALITEIDNRARFLYDSWERAGNLQQ